MSKNARLKRLRAALLVNGLTLRGFARKHGFNPYTVRTVLYRHWLADAPPPMRQNGEITKDILDTLKTYTDTRKAGLAA